ncbi:MAG: prohibitin family protein [Polyangiaceae bacterium]|nr:prohibitin family protein [Polyangiaceae bacterium]
MATIRPAASDSAKSFLRRVGATIGLLILLGIVASACSTRVDAAHVGIRVKLAGSNRGVDDIPQVTGWVFYNPLTEQIIQFPISVQNVVWTKDPHEGSPRDESITFASLEGANINCDIGLAFQIEPKQAPHIYLKFQKNDLMVLAAGYVRNAVREAFSIEASQLPVQEIYGSGKGKLVASVQKRLQDQLGKDGFVIDQITINQLRLPENIAASINRSLEATQQAVQAENRVRQVKAEAEQAITQARGQAEAARERARGEADARLITAKAEARANLILRVSTSPVVLQYRALERWNGKLPVMNGGGALPLLTFDVSKIAPLTPDEEKLLKEMLAEDAEKSKDDKPGDSGGSENKPDEKKSPAPTPPTTPPQ